MLRLLTENILDREERIMAEWIEKRLGEIAEITKLAGFEFTKYIEYNNDGEVIALRALNLRNGELDLTDIKRISRKVSDGLTRSKIYKDDILLTYTGNGYGDCAIIEENDKYHLAPNICKIVPNKNVISPYYLYCYIRSKAFYNQMSNNMTGSGQPTIPMKTIRLLKIPVPELRVQVNIANMLWLLNQKIRNNKVINNNLEQQAQAIFKEWFIDNPENNEWSTGTFSELIKSTLNGDWGKEAPTGNNTEKVYCIRGADIPEVKAGNKGKMPTRYILPKNYVAKQLTAGDIVVEISGGSPTQSTGRCTAITQSLLDRYDSGMVCTNFCKALKPKEGYSLFIYYYWQYMYGKGVFFSYENGTTGIKNLDFSGFIETETILIPPVDKVIAFDNYCNSIFNQIFANGKQNEHLAILRDTLLPKLMSGELDVSDIDL